jgi:hypothetical protein
MYAGLAPDTRERRDGRVGKDLDRAASSYGEASLDDYLVSGQASDARYSQVYGYLVMYMLCAVPQQLSKGWLT